MQPEATGGNETSVSRLNVTVVSASNLPQKDLLGSCDAYCVLGPDKKKSVQTQVVKNTYSPTWKEVFCFDLTSDEYIQLRVYDWDRTGKHDFVGAVKIPIEAAKTTDQEQVFGLLDDEGRPVIGKNKLQACVTLRLSFAQRQLSVTLQVKVISLIMPYSAYQIVAHACMCTNSSKFLFRKTWCCTV
jgi:Ca2+-dependent lipid-binding protein